MHCRDTADAREFKSTRFDSHTTVMQYMHTHVMVLSPTRERRKACRLLTKNGCESTTANDSTNLNCSRAYPDIAVTVCVVEVFVVTVARLLVLVVTRVLLVLVVLLWLVEVVVSVQSGHTPSMASRYVSQSMHA